MALIDVRHVSHCIYSYGYTDEEGRRSGYDHPYSTSIPFGGRDYSEYDRGDSERPCTADRN